MPQRGLGPRGLAAIQEAAQVFSRLSEPVAVPETPFEESSNTVAPVTATGSTRSAISTAPHETPPVGLSWLPFDSSRVAEGAYDRESETLYVRFVKPVPIGTPWVYEGVPENVWRNFRRSASPGRFVNRVLNNYDYHRGSFG